MGIRIKLDTGKNWQKYEGFEYIALRMSKDYFWKNCV